MRALLIETDKRQVREVEFDGTLMGAYRLLDVRIIQGVYIRNHVIYVDEEGLLTPSTVAKGFFKWRTFAQPLAGRGLIVGDPPGGGGQDWAPAIMTTEEALSQITWCP